MTGEYRYLPALETLESTEQWAEDNGLVLVAAERGPDGRIRGIACSPDAAMADVATRAAEALERARRLAEEAGRP